MLLPFLSFVVGSTLAQSSSTVPPPGEQRIPVTVTTSRGTVTGFRSDLGTGSPYKGAADVFLGVPYAQPPVGEMRFKLPQAICDYGNGIDATKYGPSCMQNKIFNEFGQAISEDCLTLNIITPEVGGTASYPVMVYIHGGAMVMGTATMYDYRAAITNFATKGVVVVVIQYRLSAAGFFTTFTEDFPPNRGIYDQIMALRWVQEEIAAFGGDPKQVTLNGHSAGGVSVSALSLSPLAKGLFNKVIAQSGAILMEFGVPNNPMGDINQVSAEKICGFTAEQWKAGDFTALKNCLAGKTSEELVAVDMNLFPLRYTVNLDGALFPKSPSELAAERPTYPTIIGYATDEFFTFSNYSDYKNMGRSTVLQTLNTVYPYITGANAQMFSDMMISTFNRNGLKDDDHVGWLRLTVEAFSDMVITGFLRRDAQWHLNNNNKNLFLYNFNHPDAVCKLFDIEGYKPVYHGAELCYLWMSPESWTKAGATVTADDLTIADTLSTIWTNFVKQKDGEQPFDGWTPVSDANSFEYYRFDLPTGSMQNKWLSDGNVLFNDVLPHLVGAFPPETVDAATQQQLDALGARLVAQFRGAVCPAKRDDSSSTSFTSVPNDGGGSTPATPPTTTKGQETTVFSLTLLVLFFVTA